MSRVCHETGQNVYNPFYVMNAVLRDKENNRLAVSNLEVSLCTETANRLVLNDLPDSPDKMEEDVFYGIEQAGGTEGGFSGCVQLCGGYGKSGNQKYVPRELANSKLPRSARDLLSNPEWFELVDGEFKSAEWAKEMYARLQE